MKLPIPFVVILILFLTDCNTPHRIVRNGHFFESIDSIYGLGNSNVYLKTKDERYRLKKPVVENGKLVAEIVNVPYKEKNFILFYRKKYNDVVEHVLDPGGEQSDLIRLSDKNIHKIVVLDKEARIFKRKTLYHRHPFTNVIGKIFKTILILYLVLGTITIFALFTVVAIQECYIATMVYGSRDAPEVVILRKFRDEELLPFFFGRILVGLYYRFSPLFVRLFRNNKTVNSLFRRILDSVVAKISVTEPG